MPPIAVVRTTCIAPQGGKCKVRPHGEKRRSNSHDIELFEKLDIFDFFRANFVELFF